MSNFTSTKYIFQNSVNVPYYFIAVFELLSHTIYLAKLAYLSFSADSTCTIVHVLIFVRFFSIIVSVLRYHRRAWGPYNHTRTYLSGITIAPASPGYPDYSIFFCRFFFARQ